MFKKHLRNLLFCDAWATSMSGMNNNAMDRSCVYDGFLDDLKRADFQVAYQEFERRARERREEFEPGYFNTLAELDEYAEWATNRSFKMLMRQVLGLKEEPASVSATSEPVPAGRDFDPDLAFLKEVIS